MSLNKRGFTLIEIFVTIIILGILVTLGYFGIRGVINRGNDSYYKSQEDMLILAGREYFTDHREELPKEIREEATVTLETLINEKYIDPIKDENEVDCNFKESGVTAQKITDKDYQYYGRLTCDGYKTAKDTTKPVISFEPNKESSQEPIKVTMKVTDNNKVTSYRYVITKDGETYQDSGYQAYSGDLEITLSEVGMYQITGYAIDETGNSSTKKSGNYSIYETIDCQNATITSSTKANTWVNKNITLNIAVPSNTYRYEVYLKKNSGDYELVNNYLGASSTKLTLNSDGTYQAKVIAYDKDGKSCTSTSSVYKLDKTAPSNVKATGNPGCVTQPNKVTLTLSATETGSGIQNWRYGTSSTLSSMKPYAKSNKNSFKAQFSSVVNRTYYFRACDNAGNCSSSVSSKICIKQANPDKNFKITCKRTCSNNNCHINNYYNDRIWTWKISGAGTGIKKDSSLKIVYNTAYVDNYCSINYTNQPRGSSKRCGYATFNTSTIRFCRSFAKSSIIGTACTKGNSYVTGKCRSCTIYN